MNTRTEEEDIMLTIILIKARSLIKEVMKTEESLEGISINKKAGTSMVAWEEEGETILGQHLEVEEEEAHSMN